MTHQDQIDAFAKRFEAVLEHTAKEYDLTAVEVVGILQVTVCRMSVNVMVSPRLLPAPPYPPKPPALDPSAG